jgi:hypothetical protein
MKLSGYALITWGTGTYQIDREKKIQKKNILTNSKHQTDTRKVEHRTNINRHQSMKR